MPDEVKQNKINLVEEKYFNTYMTFAFLHG